MVPMRRTPRPRFRVLVAVSAVLAVLPMVSSPAAQADNLPPLGVIVRGHGNGHGRGMSQYGALGWATKLNASWQDILNFYYGGGGRTLTTLTEADAGATPGGVMSVRLEAMDGKRTSVVSDNLTAS